VWPCLNYNLFASGTLVYVWTFQCNDFDISFALWSLSFVDVDSFATLERYMLPPSSGSK
jgi:hypothetical protein